MNALHVAHGTGSSVAGIASLTAMWFTMMAVMMAPVAWPWAVAFNRFSLAASHSSRRAATVAFIAGYAAAWLLYSLAAATVQRMAGDVLPSGIASLALIGAGLAQFSSLKRACLRHCRNPFSYLLARWRDGPQPAWRIGFAHGVYCVGCCWALMGTMLVVGITNLWWMSAVVIATAAEQASRHGESARVAIGILLVIVGLAHLA